MNPTDAINLRLFTQRLAGEPFERPEQMVQALVAVQSQDFAGAKWSAGQRSRNCNDADVHQTFNEGKFLRTHVLRPTWHFVSPSDIRWMQQLTGPHVKVRMGTYYRKLELDDAIFTRSQTVISLALSGGHHLTRAEIGTILVNEGINVDGLRLGHIMMQAELDAVVCSGPVHGKQHTYALLDERVSDEKKLCGDEALAELTRRFFQGHGPATLKEYARWSGLTMAKCRSGLELVRESLAQATVGGQSHWFDAAITDIPPAPFVTYLLPEYDECYLTYPGINFPDLPWTIDPEAWSDSFYRPIIINGYRAGTWRRTIDGKQVVLEANVFARLDGDQLASLNAAVERYSAFLELPGSLTFLRLIAPAS